MQHIVQGLTVQERWGWGSSMPGGPTSTEPEQVHPGGTYLECIYNHLYTHTHSWHHRQQGQTERALTQHWQPHPSHLSGWPVQSSTSENAQIHTSVPIPPAAGLRHSVCPTAAPRSQSHQLHAPGHLSPQGHSLTALWWCRSSHTPVQLARIPQVLSSPLRDTGVPHPRQQLLPTPKVLWCWLVWVGFMPGHKGWDSAGIALGKAQQSVPSS